MLWKNKQIFKKPKISFHVYSKIPFFFSEINSPFTSAHAFSCHREVIRCFQLNTYINTMGLAAFSSLRTKQTHAWEDTDWITSASGLLRCVENADTRRLGRNHRKACAVPPDHSSIQNSSVARGACCWSMQQHIRQSHFCYSVTLWANREDTLLGFFRVVVRLFLAARRWLSHSYSTRKLPNLCLPIPLLFSLILFRFYPFSLIVCNSYQVSLRPTSAASRSAARRAKCLLSAFYWLPGRRVVVVQCNLGTPITGFNKSSCFLMVVKPLSSFPPFSKCVGWLE